MSGKSGIAGSGSNMSVEMYLKKMEQTCIFEDPELSTNYMRATLKDIRPDEPLFESDVPRRNNYSTDKLNLRHYGKRVPTMPYLPEGTFLDYDGLSPDPRGTAGGPDMRKHKEQQEARNKFIKFYSDEDYSVPSEGINQKNMIKLKQSSFYDVKDRLKIFDESIGSFHNGGVNQINKKTTAECSQVMDDKKKDMQDEMAYNRKGAINDLSNDTSIGWRRTTDHRFKVAKYSMLRKSMSAESQNIIKNRSNAHIDHDIMTSWRDQNTVKSITIKMIDIATQKSRSMKMAQGTVFDKSITAQVGRTKKLTPADLISGK